MSRIDRLRVRLHRRKHNRERKRHLHQGHRAKREAKAVRTLRARIRALLDRRHRLPRVMFDDVSLNLVPRSARAIGYYADGGYANGNTAKGLFPKARKVSIAVFSNDFGDVLDIEPGDATISEAPGWYRLYKDKRPHGIPIFYTSVSNVDALVSTLAGAGISRGHYRIWSAHYSGKHICAPDTCGLTQQHVDGTQWTSSSHERSLDESYLRVSFWERGTR